MSQHLLLYLDESGDLGFNFAQSASSHYFVMTALICHNQQSAQTVVKAIKRTCVNKLSKNTHELKGWNTPINIKKYFFNQCSQNKDWQLVTITANKKAWAQHYDGHKTINKNLFYDEVAKRLLSQLQFVTEVHHIQLIVDKSKTTTAMQNFNLSISESIRPMIPTKTLLSLTHRPSFVEPGLQAIDLFCWGIFRKYEYQDNIWYDVFKDRIALETEFKF